MNSNSELLHKLTLAQVSSCSCLTKTPEAQWHDTHCLYRVLAEAMAVVTAAGMDPQEAVGEVADMKYNRVQFYRTTGDTTKPYLVPGTKLYVAPPRKESD